MKKIVLFFTCLGFLSAQAQLVNKTLIVPEFNNGLVKIYFPSSGSSILANASYTINLATLPNGLSTAGSPNCVAMFNNDLFVTITSANQRIYKFPGYGTNPITAIANVSQVTNVGNDYVGIAFDAAGNLYTAEGSFGNNNLVKYNAATNYATSVNLGNGGLTSYFANITFDASGNLWATDYWNNRVVMIKSNDLSTMNASINSLQTNAGDWAAGGGICSNTDLTLKNKIIHSLFNQPEGIAFDSNGNLWVANNNDGTGIVTNEAASLVKISPALQTNVFNNASTEATVGLSNSANGYFVYNVPSSSSGRAQFGGMQIDKNINRIYVNEQVSGKGMWFETVGIADIINNFNNYQLEITSTNPGNGGIYLAAGSEVPLVSLEEEISPNSAEVSVFPNPNQGNFSIQNIENIKKISFFDSNGKLIPFTQNSKSNIQLSNVNSGIYILRTEFKSGEIASKTLIVK